MVDKNEDKLQPETDPRLPSGLWRGHFFQPWYSSSPVKMELGLTFANGGINGTGNDAVGEFDLKGKYDLQKSELYWNKRYRGKHVVYCRGFFEEQHKGIWGVWEIPEYDRGGFHIWPRGTEHNSHGLHIEQSSDTDSIPIAISDYNSLS